MCSNLITVEEKDLGDKLRVMSNKAEQGHPTG